MPVCRRLRGKISRRVAGKMANKWNFLQDKEAPPRSRQSTCTFLFSGRQFSVWIVLTTLFALFCLSSWAQQDVIVGIDVRGNRRIPQDTIKARIFTKPGDIYDAAGLERDFNSLWNTGYFEDIKFLREQTPKGWRIIVQVKEKPTIREINYVGLSSVSNSDVLDRFKQEKVGLTVESQYDPTRIKKAENSVKNLLS